MSNRLAILLILALGLCTSRFAIAAEVDWKRHTVHAPPDAVFSAADKIIRQHHEVKESNRELRIIRFHVGTTAWSWGYNMTASFEPVGSDSTTVSISIEKSGGPALSWGSGQKEVGKIFKWMDDELSKQAKEAPAKMN